ncbi:MAG: hypothetical protein EPO41_17790 [Reyranella sp.]|uniref:hypothetical protein n=1 Tax=Reyranella sp. TaxID=1929291 RepID=UPI00120609EC|nr:hypothetical protein [Reyranella sp.]TAJ90288.1 MAG: hypothetical protein EPO41_17790 [Reyranella sp.]
MVHNLTLVHLLLVGAAGGCIYLSLREVRRRYISTWRLFAPAILALFAGAILSLLQFAEHQPPWLFGAALAAGFVVGAARGIMIGIRHDMYRPQVNLTQAAKLLLVWVAVLLGAAVAVECLGALLASPHLEIFRLGAALVAMFCGSAMLGRALLLTIRLHRADRGSS